MESLAKEFLVIGIAWLSRYMIFIMASDLAGFASSLAALPLLVYAGISVSYAGLR